MKPKLQPGLIDSGPEKKIPRHPTRFRVACAAFGVAAILCAGVQLNAAQTFTGMDVGAPSQHGSVVTNTDGSLTVTGGGYDIWNTSDDCYYYYTWQSGTQWAAQLRVDADIQGGTVDWPKCELMVRASDQSSGPLGPDAFIAMMYTKPTALDPGGANWLADQYRSVASGQGDWYVPTQPTYKPPVWMVILRMGDVFSLFYSLDDNVSYTDYLDIDTSTNAFTGTDNGTSFGTPFPDPVAVGVAVTAGQDPGSAAVARVSHLGVGSIVPPTVMGASVPLQNVTNYQGSEVSLRFATTNNAWPNVTYPNYLTYQWFKNGTALSGATGAIYTKLVDAADSTAKYYCTATLLAPFNTVVKGAASTTNTIAIIPGAVSYTNGLKSELFSGATLTNVENGATGPANQIYLVPKLDVPGPTLFEYVNRVSGWYIPPATDNYVFFIADDDVSDLWLSTDNTPENKRIIAQEMGWSSQDHWLTARDTGVNSAAQKRSDQWTADGSGFQPPYANGIALTGGQLYYIELDHHEDGSGGNLLGVTAVPASQVAGLTDGTPSNMDGKSNLVLMTWAPAKLVWTTEPANTFIALTKAGAFQAVASSDSEMALLYQWYYNGQPVAGATTTAIATGAISNANNGDTYFCVANTPVGGLVITSAVASVTFVQPIVETGWCTLEYWANNTDRTTVENGTAGAPTYVWASPGFGMAFNDEAGDNYVTRISGFFIAPATDDYVFWVGSDDDSDLFLSTDSTMANKRLIAQEVGWSPALDWGVDDGTGPASQTHSDTWSPDNGTTTPYAAGIHLIAGQKYYMEDVHHEGGGGDWSGATYQRLHTTTGMPDPAPINGQDTRLRGAVIAGNFLPSKTVTVTQQPASLTLAPTYQGTFTLTAAGTTDSSTVVGTEGDPRPLFTAPAYVVYQWQKDGNDIPGATGSSFTYSGPISPSDNGAKLTCNVRGLGYADSSGNPIWAASQPAVLTVSPNVPLVFEPGIVRVDRWWNHVLADIVGGTVVSPPDFSVTTPGFEISTNNESGDNYVERVSGFFIPPTTDTYIFWCNSDDYCDLFVSTDSSPLNKRLVAQELAWSAAFNWTGDDGAAADAWLKRSDQFTDWTTGLQYPNGIRLVAGQKYYMEVIHYEGGGGDNVEVTYSSFSQMTAPSLGDDTLLYGSQIGMLTPQTHVSFTTQPASVTTENLLPVAFAAQVATDSTIAFNNTCGDPRPAVGQFLEYQWYRNNTAIAGATESDYIIPQAMPADNGAQFYCAVRAVGMVDSSGKQVWSNSALATLTVQNVGPALAYSASYLNSNPVNFTNPAQQYVCVTFNKAMDPAKALTLANYTLSAGSGLTPVSVMISSNEMRAVAIAVTGTPVFPFTVTVANMADALGDAFVGRPTASVNKNVPLTCQDIGVAGDPSLPGMMFVTSSNAYTIQCRRQRHL